MENIFLLGLVKNQQSNKVEQGLEIEYLILSLL